MINIALYGYNIIENSHFINILENKNCQINYICEENLSLSYKALDFKNRFDMSSIKIVIDKNIILKDKSVDAIIICTPIDSCYTFGMDALSNDKHILFENPLSLDKIDKCFYLAKKKNRIISIYYSKSNNNNNNRMSYGNKLDYFFKYVGNKSPGI